MDGSPLSPEEIRAAAEVHHELGPEYSDAVVASFLEKLDGEIAARIDARLAEAISARPGGAAPILGRQRPWFPAGDGDRFRRSDGLAALVLGPGKSGPWSASPARPGCAGLPGNRADIRSNRLLAAWPESGSARCPPEAGRVQGIFTTVVALRHCNVLSCQVHRRVDARLPHSVN
jgi:hypothetical protein